MLSSGGEPLQLTNDEGDKIVNSFSPDGKEVYYTRLLGRDEVWAVPALGGTPSRVAYASMRFLQRMAPSFIIQSLKASGSFVRQNPD